MSGKGLSIILLLITGSLTLAVMGCDKGTGTDQTLKPIEIITPRGGESYKEGQPVTIKWQINDAISILSVGIMLSVDNGKSYSMLVGHSIPAETTSVAWTVTSDQLSNQCIIKVYQYGDQSIFDESGAFSTTE